MLFRQEYIKGSAENRHRTGKSTGRRKDGLLIAPNFVSHKSGLMSRLWSGILKLVGIKFEHQWSGEEYLGWLEENGWKMQYAKNFPTRIALMYAECIRKSE